MENKGRLRPWIAGLKMTSILCFWLAMMTLLFPLSGSGGAANGPAQSVARLDAAAVAQMGDQVVAAGQEAIAQAQPESAQLIPLGRTTGIKMFTEGTMIVGFSELEAAGGKSPAAVGGLETGDVIVAINELEVGSNEELVARLAQVSGPKLSLTVKRDGQTMKLQVEGIYDREAGSWKLGCWVRDSIAGIGTITFVDPENGAFGALGHGISDADTGQLMPIQEGSIMESTVAEVKRGQAGVPGELSGKFNLVDNQGVLYSNTNKGIFGQITDRQVYSEGQAMAIGKKSELREGKAYILSNVVGQDIRRYEIEIVKVYNDSDDSARDMMIRVVDSQLIEITGGIVQGMSGSPIIQGDKLVGAVTHVLINDPLRGYAISIENMLAEAMGA